MKSWIQLLVIGAVVIGVYGDDEEHLRNACIEESGVTIEQLVTDYRKGFTEDGGEPEVRCYHACMARHQGWLTAKNEVYVDKLLRPIDQVPPEHREISQRIRSLCLKKGPTTCDTGYFITKCLDKIMEGQQ